VPADKRMTAHPSTPTSLTSRRASALFTRSDFGIFLTDERQAYPTVGMRYSDSWIFQLSSELVVEIQPSSFPQRRRASCMEDIEIVGAVLEDERSGFARPPRAVGEGEDKHARS